MGNNILIFVVMIASSILFPIIIGFINIPKKWKTYFTPRLMWSLVIFSILLLVYSFFATSLATDFLGVADTNELLKTDDGRNILAAKGQIGDRYGGLMNPIIAIAGVIITGLAFYIQYEANRLQISNFKEEQDANKLQNQKLQIESTFYQMLGLHKENVNEMRYMYKNKEYLGRDVFPKMKENFHNIINSWQPSKSPLINLECYDDSAANALNQNKFNFCYFIFFFNDDNKAFHKYSQISDGYKHSFKNINISNYYPSDASNKLGHYFRHLFLMVKYIVNQPISLLSDNEKKAYLKILRAQLSNNEQAMLFYNWVAEGFGSNWENENNNFFTQYNMIHNLQYSQLWNYYGYSGIIDEKLESLKQKFESINDEGERMFEIDE
jgi:Putative phage abortive infection protein